MNHFKANDVDYTRYPFLKDLINKVKNEVEEQLNNFQQEQNFSEINFTRAKEEVFGFVAAEFSERFAKKTSSKTSSIPGKRRKITAWNMHLTSEGVFSSGGDKSQKMVEASKTFSSLSKEEKVALQAKADQRTEERVMLEATRLPKMTYQKDLEMLIQTMNDLGARHKLHMVVIYSSESPNKLVYPSGSLSSSGIIIYSYL